MTPDARQVDGVAQDFGSYIALVDIEVCAAVVWAIVKIGHCALLGRDGSPANHKCFGPFWLQGWLHPERNRKI